jgi:stage V sporulation protein SpoVS
LDYVISRQTPHESAVERNIADWLAGQPSRVPADILAYLLEHGETEKNRLINAVGAGKADKGIFALVSCQRKGLLKTRRDQSVSPALVYYHIPEEHRSAVRRVLEG